MRRLFPRLLAVAFAIWSYRPAADSLVGWGQDPLFNLWNFEVVWHNLSARLPLWQAPIFAGSPLGLAFSENQIAAAFFALPLRIATGNGAIALGAFATTLSLLAFACAAGWLRAIGVRDLAEWGGLLFAGCGWLQSQYAHYQNLCIFVLPLAFWAWTAYARDPRPLRLCACGLAFGWIAGWNVYFQVFADLCLLVLAVRVRRPLPLLLAMAVQAPFLWKYMQLGHEIGGYRALVSYGAGLRSVLGSAHRPRLFLPSFEVDIEAAGYLGPVWLALMAGSLRRRKSRPWLFAAALGFWAALGRGHGLFDLLAALPGVSGMRAAGRVQVMVFLFSLPAVLGWLESLGPPRASVAVALALADLVPAALPERAQIDPALFGGLTPLSRELARSSDPVLVLPESHARFMLDDAQTFTPFFGGSSGREPPGQAMLHWLEERGLWQEALELSRPRRVLLLAPDAARRLPPLSLRGCYAHLDLGTPCLYTNDPAPLPPLHLARDTIWQGTELRAAKSGVLDAREVDRCRLRRKLHPFGFTLSQDLPLPLPAHARYSAGDSIFRVDWRPLLFRDQIEYVIVCQ